MVERIASKIYYGWVMVLVGFLIITIIYGSRLSFGTLFGSLLDEFGWSRAIVTTVFSFSVICQAALQPLAGALIDKYGPRRIIQFGAILLCLSFIMFGQSYGLISIYISYGLCFSIAVITTGLVVNTTMISYWFIKKRGIASGAIVVGSSLGIFIFNPLLAFLIENYGWRTSVTILGLTSGFLIFAIISLLGRNKPQDVGQNIDGISDEEMAQIKSLKETIKKPVLPSNNLTFREALKSKYFWLLMVVYTGELFAWFSVTNHTVMAMVDIGLSTLIAATLFGYIGLITIFSGLFFAWLSDLLGTRKQLLFLGLLCTGIVIMMLSSISSSNLTHLYTIIILLGIAHGPSVLLSAFVADCFGVLSMGKIWGTITTAGLIGASIGPVVIGHFYDITGSYALSWQIAACSMFVAMVCLIFVKIRPQSVSQDKIK